MKHGRSGKQTNFIGRHDDITLVVISLICEYLVISKKRNIEKLNLKMVKVLLLMNFN